MKKIMVIIAVIFLTMFLTGGKPMADKNIQMGQRNKSNTEWDKHYPITKAENVLTESGTVASELAEKVNSLGRSISVKDFGAVGDWNITSSSGTDDTAAINLAIAEATLHDNSTLFFPYGGGYCASETIVFPININVVMDAPIVYMGTLDVPAIVVGASGQVIFNKKLSLRAMRNVQSNWSSEENIGIKIINANTCDIDILYANRFTIATQFMGSGGGFAYNEVHLYYLINGKIGADLTNETSSTIGWCNENNFYGGRFGNLSGTNLTSSRYGVRITSKDGTYLNNNNNVFHKPSFELGVPTTGEAVPILLEYADNNTFKEIRNEGNSITTVRITNASAENVVTSGYGYVNTDDQSTYPSTSYSSIRNKFKEDVNKPIFNSGALHKNACYYDGSTRVHIPHIMHGNYGDDPTVYNASLTSKIVLNDNYLECIYGIGIFVSTKSNKTFIVRKDTDTGYGGRVNIRCYDASGTILTSVGEGHPYVKGIAGGGLTYVTAYGGSYGTGVDGNLDTVFTVGDDVAYIAIILGGGSANLRIRSFSIYAREKDCAVWAGYEEVLSGCNIGIAVPTAGTWAVGRRIVNAVPTVGQPKAWICTVEGTPGTWVSEGDL